MTEEEIKSRLSNQLTFFLYYRIIYTRIEMRYFNMIKLICVTADNHNKFYYMEDLNNGTFKVTYGRVGSSERVVNYPISQWDKKYNEKIAKGYIDVTEKITAKKKSADLDVADPQVRDLIEFLMKEARQSIKRDYSISAEAVTQQQLDEAQSLLDQISAISDSQDIDAINSKLRQLYTIIPRKMKDTRAFFLKAANTPYLIELLQSEQSKLDTLRTQVDIGNKDSDGLTLADLGFNCEVASQADRDLIIRSTDFRLTNHRVWKITNKATEAAFNPDHLKTKLLYHGSRNENFLSILQNGLKIRPKGVQTTGSMFGDGIYGANKARKSIGYTSLRGSYWSGGSSSKAYLAIFEFATGTEWRVLDNQSWSGWMSRIDQAQVKSHHCDSVFARGGVDLRNDEYVIYDSNQCTIRYLIELTA